MARLGVPIVTLESGDRLSRDEFERRYGQCPHIKKAELIEGVVYVASPVRIRYHAQPHSDLIFWAKTYCLATPGVMMGNDGTVRLDAKNETQPDIFLRYQEGGQSRISDDDYIEGAPELIAEIAASSASYDLHDKKDVYCRCGVKEYLVWVVPEQIFHWFRLDHQIYVCQPPDQQGIIQSSTFPGLWLNIPALLSGEMLQVLETLQAGLNSPEHQRFVQRLSKS